MKKITTGIIVLAVFVLMLVACPAVAGGGGGHSGTAGATATQGQIQTSTNIVSITDPATPTPTVVGGGGDPKDIPRSWMVPMYPATAPNYPYFGGPYRWGRQLLDFSKLLRYKSRFTSQELENLAKRPGKLNIAESFFLSYGFSPFIEVVLNQPQDGEDLRRFNRSYEVIGEIGIDGIEGADHEKILGEAGLRACQKGGDLLMPIQQDGNFRLDAGSRYTTIGISPSGMTGGSGAVGGGAVLFSHTWGKSYVGYNTQPHATFVVFRSMGVPYIPFAPPKVRKPSPTGTGTVEEVRSGNSQPAKKPDSSVLLESK